VIEWQVSVEYPDATVSLSVWATTLRAATDLVYERLTARDTAPLGMRVQGTPPISADMVDTAGVRAMLGGISQRSLARLQSDADFPAPVQQYGGGRGIWRRSTIEHYASSR
jgi:hypothetical protein